MGSLICESQDFVQRARKWRKMLGGGMRQVGVLAAAGVVAIQKMVDRLAEDHANARRLAQGLARIPNIIVHPGKVQTNIVIFEFTSAVSGADFLQQLADEGVKFLHRGGQQVRAVTNRMVSAEDVDEALARMERLMSKLD